MAGVVAAVAALSACTVGPNYQKPSMPTPPAYAGLAATPRTRIVASEPDLAAWWTVFNDPTLSDLVRRGLADNPDLQSAISKVREARQQETVTASAEYPALNASGNAVTVNSNRKQPAASSGGSSSGGAASGLTIPSHLELYSAGFDATWEVDIFGGVRRGVEAAKDQTAAAQWTERDGQVSLVSEIANDYLTLRATQARIALGQAELQRQKDLFVLIRDRRAAGFTTELDVNQQTTQVATAAAQIPQLNAQAKTQIHALSILLGQPPETLSTELQAVAGALPPPPPILPVGLPSELLERRPDIRAAERRLAAANAGIGVQEAKLYPKLNLIGLASFAGMSIGDLFSAQNLTSVGVGMLTQPIFNAGKTKASIAGAKEEKIQAQYAYETTVLGAFRDVEDGLARYTAEDTRRASLAQSVTAANKSLKIAQDQYAIGLVNFTTVLQAENAQLNAQDQLVQSDAQALTDLVAIYKALGGGWSS
jgi:NodT family efflux transporter outer membrane factor (OMF) lipoprotein